MPARLLPKGKELEELAQRAMRATLDEGVGLAQEFGFASWGSLLTQLAKQGYKRRQYQVMPSMAPVYDTPPLIIEPRVLALFDPHFCFHNAEFINRCFDLAYAWKVSTLYWGGDYLDFKVFGRFVVWPEDVFENEIIAFEQAQKAAEDIFKRQIAGEGNHEERLDRFISRYLSAHRIGKIFTKAETLEVSTYHYAIYQPEDTLFEERWVLGHPDDYSRIPAMTPTKYAMINYCHTAAGHNHYVGMAKCPNGHHWGIDAGHCTDPTLHDYKGLRMTSRPSWANGALILMDGHPYLLTPDIDWIAYRRLYV